LAPQLAAGCASQPACAGGFPRATATQVPTLSGRLQATQLSPHGESQQTPSAQMRVTQSSAEAHASPSFLLPGGPATRPPSDWRRQISSPPHA
jgi:hypothetical protein